MQLSQTIPDYAGRAGGLSGAETEDHCPPLRLPRRSEEGTRELSGLLSLIGDAPPVCV